jgi:hypothetical protein
MATKATLIASLFLVTAGCSHVNWPKVLQCVDPVAQAELAAASRILAGNGDPKSELENLALQYAPSTVECAVQSIIQDLSARKGAARDDHSLSRGRAFLAEVQK